MTGVEKSDFGSAWSCCRAGLPKMAVRGWLMRNCAALLEKLSPGLDSGGHKRLLAEVEGIVAFVFGGSTPADDIEGEKL